MAVLKRIAKSAFVQKLAGLLMSLYIRLVLITARIEKHHHEKSLPYMSSEKNGIFIFWHGHMMMMPCLRPKKRIMSVLVSLHRDGQLIGDIVSRFNVRLVHGSSSRGGAVAAKTIMRLIDDGHNIGITPDGPRGPHQKVKNGAVNISKNTQTPILPVTIGASRCKHMRSWDRFTLIYPFSRIVFCVGEPIDVSKELEHSSNDQVQAMIQDAMDRLTQQSDSLAASNRSGA